MKIKKYLFKKKIIRIEQTTTSKSTINKSFDKVSEKINEISKSVSNQENPKNQDNQLYIIETIVSNNVENLKNKELHEIILRNIIFDDFTVILQIWIYQAKYTAKDITTLLSELINKSLIHTDITVDTFDLLKMWIKEYLIDDLIKNTTLVDDRNW